MAKTILGIFSNRDAAEDAIRELESLNYNPKDISIVMRDTDETHHFAYDTGTNVVGGAAAGATTGGVIGGIAGLLIGIGAITIPGIGALLIGGPIAAALGLTGAAASTVTGAVTGALAGGLVGALMGMGIPEDEARVYEERIKEGGILIAVPATVRTEDEVRDILSNNGADQINSVNTPQKIEDEEYYEEDYGRPARDEYAPHTYAGMKGGRSAREENLYEDDEDYRPRRAHLRRRRS